MFLNLRLTFGEDLLSLSVQKSSNLCVFSVLLLTSFHNRSPCSFGHGRRRLTNRQAFSLGVIRHVLGVRYEASPRARVIVIHILEEPLLGELLLGQGLCEGLDISLHEIEVLGLITCVGVGFVRRHHLLVGGVHSVNPHGSRRAAGTAGD